MNAHEPIPESTTVGGWTWRAPDYVLAFKSYASGVVAFARRWPITSALLFVSLVLSIYVFRYVWHPLTLIVSIKADVIVSTVLIYGAFWFLFRRYLRDWHWTRRAGTIAGVAVAIFLMWQGAAAHRYLGQYWRYQTLNLVELSALPITDYERVLSLNGVHTLGKRLRDQTERVSKPTFIKSSTGYCWSMAIEPDRVWQQWNAPVDEAACVPAHEATPDLSTRGQIPVRFEVGENLLWSRNIDTCVRRALSPLRFFSYEPAQPFLGQNDKGKWVWIVPWTKWVGTYGVFFPRPEFGGVQIIEQSEVYGLARKWFWESPKRVLAGCGQWIPAEDVHKHAYLRGQNLMPDTVSRSYAESFRFQDSILGPSGYFKSGDIRVADSEDDVNRQPYTSFYRMPLPNGAADKLYDSFALEPNDPNKRALVTSVFVPGDGIGPSYVYRHSLKNEAPLGVTWVESQVRASSPDYFWSDRRVEEHRYFIRDLADSNGVVKRRLMYLSIVVLVEKRTDEKGVVEVTPGSIPLIAITDSDTRAVEWVDPHHPELWDEKVRAKFAPLWGRRVIKN